jgi:ABC-type transport system involved in cytochrome bd biosynthesis fused ATPase/permease subunit
MTIILLSTLVIVATILFLAIKNKNKKLAVLEAKYGINAAERIIEAVGSYRELLLRGKRQFFADRIGAARMLQADATANSTYLMNINKYLLEASILLITLLIAGIQFLLSDALRSVATLTLFLAAISRIAPAVFRIQQNALTIKSALGAAKPTLDLINSLQLSVNKSSSKKEAEIVPVIHDGFSGSVVIKDLCFKYPGSENNAVQDINVQLNSGKYIALVGQSGAGKSLRKTLHDACISKSNQI